MADNENFLEEKLQDVAKHYITAKRNLLYSESSTHKVDLGVINEFRNSFDHVIKGVVNNDKTEFDKAIEHLRRAAYDSCESISMDSMLNIHRKINKYDSSIIVKILPTYYSDIYPRLQEIQEAISIEREKSDELFTKDDHLSKYVSLNSELIELDKTVSKAVIGMEKYYKKTMREKTKKSFIGLLKTLVIIIITAVITTYINNVMSTSSSDTETKQDLKEIPASHK